MFLSHQEYSPSQARITERPFRVATFNHQAFQFTVLTPFVTFYVQVTATHDAALTNCDCCLILFQAFLHRVLMQRAQFGHQALMAKLGSLIFDFAGKLGKGSSDDRKLGQS